VSLTQLPADIGNLCNLRSLDLRDNLLRTLPESIAYLAQLQRMDLGSNDLDELVCGSMMPFIFTYALQPTEIGKLTRLRELYIDNNHLEALPAHICQLKQCMLSVCPHRHMPIFAVECLDVSENRLLTLPDDMGEMQVGTYELVPIHVLLQALYDLTLSNNHIEQLPHSIGRLKKLQILKVDRNRITQLTPAIGSCTMLQELMLTENQLTVSWEK
jgi:protein scribble